MDALKKNTRPTALFGATMWWPLSARLATAFLRHGCGVSAVCPPGHPLRLISGVDRIYPYRGLNSLNSLKHAILAAAPDIIVPCDDGVVWQLHDLHAQEPGLRPLIELSLGLPEGYSTIHSRGGLLQAAVEMGIRVPITQTVSSEGDVANAGDSASVVLKLDGTWGGTGVEIAHSRIEAIAAFRKISRPLGASVAWKRLLINRDPLALWSWRKHETPRITLQQFIPGRPANTMFACWQGEVLSSVTVEVLCSQGATGAATVVHLIRNDAIERAARLLARRFHLSGFHGLDFILEQHTGEAYLIELNPRCTQLGHLRLPYQGDLAGALCARLKDEPPAPVEDPIDREIIAFFPQAFSWNPKSPYLHHGHHDVPWEEPGLVRELLQELSWPNRQLPARIYHHLRAPKREQEVKFDYALPEHTLRS